MVISETAVAITKQHVQPVMHKIQRGDASDSKKCSRD